MPVAADFIDSVQGAAFAGDDVIGGFAPDERLWLGVVEQEIIVDGRVQIIEAGIAFPANASRGDLGKEPFDQVQPRREGRREGPLEAGRDVCPTRPSPQASCGGIVIQHRMHRPSALNRAVDMAQELQERFGWVARHAIATDKPGLHVKHREDRRSVEAHIIMSHGLRATLLERQAGLDPDKRLNLRFLIDAKHHCPL